MALEHQLGPQQGPSQVIARKPALALVRTGWAGLVVVAMAIMTKGLWATVYFEPTDTAIADERRGHVLIAVASVLLVMLAAFAYFALSAPLSTPIAILAAVAVCVGVALTQAVALLSLLAAYPLILGALVGGLFVRREPEPWLSDLQRTDHPDPPSA